MQVDSQNSTKAEKIFKYSQGKSKGGMERVNQLSKWKVSKAVEAPLTDG